MHGNTGLGVSGSRFIVLQLASWVGRNGQDTGNWWVKESPKR